MHGAPATESRVCQELAGSLLDHGRMECGCATRMGGYAIEETEQRIRNVAVPCTEVELVRDILGHLEWLTLSLISSASTHEAARGAPAEFATRAGAFAVSLARVYAAKQNGVRGHACNGQQSMRMTHRAADPSRGHSTKACGTLTLCQDFGRPRKTLSASSSRDSAQTLGEGSFKSETSCMLVPLRHDVINAPSTLSSAFSIDAEFHAEAAKLASTFQGPSFGVASAPSAASCEAEPAHSNDASEAAARPRAPSRSHTLEEAHSSQAACPHRTEIASEKHHGRLQPTARDRNALQRVASGTSTCATFGPGDSARQGLPVMKSSTHVASKTPTQQASLVRCLEGHPLRSISVAGSQDSFEGRDSPPSTDKLTSRLLPSPPALLLACHAETCSDSAAGACGSSACLGPLEVELLDTVCQRGSSGDDGDPNATRVIVAVGDNDAKGARAESVPVWKGVSYLSDTSMEQCQLASLLCDDARAKPQPRTISKAAWCREVAGPRHNDPNAPLCQPSTSPLGTRAAVCDLDAEIQALEDELGMQMLPRPADAAPLQGAADDATEGEHAWYGRVGCNLAAHTLPRDELPRCRPTVDVRTSPQRMRSQMERAGTLTYASPSATAVAHGSSTQHNLTSGSSASERVELSACVRVARHSSHIRQHACVRSSVVRRQGCRVCAVKARNDSRGRSRDGRTNPFDEADSTSSFSRAPAAHLAPQVYAKAAVMRRRTGRKLRAAALPTIRRPKSNGRAARLRPTAKVRSSAKYASARRADGGTNPHRHRAHISELAHWRPQLSVEVDTQSPARGGLAPWAMHRSTTTGLPQDTDNGSSQKHSFRESRGAHGAPNLQQPDAKADAHAAHGRQEDGKQPALSTSGSEAHVLDVSDRKSMDQRRASEAGGAGVASVQSAPECVSHGSAKAQHRKHSSWSPFRCRCMCFQPGYL